MIPDRKIETTVFGGRVFCYLPQKEKRYIATLVEDCKCTYDSPGEWLYIPAWLIKKEGLYEAGCIVWKREKSFWNLCNNIIDTITNPPL